jgi:hypothetical protein
MDVEDYLKNLGILIIKHMLLNKSTPSYDVAVFYDVMMHKKIFNLDRKETQYYFNAQMSYASVRQDCRTVVSNLQNVGILDKCKDSNDLNSQHLTFKGLWFAKTIHSDILSEWGKFVKEFNDPQRNSTYP